MLKLRTPAQLEKEELGDHYQEVANVMKNITPELLSLNDPRQHLSIAASIIVSCFDAIYRKDREFSEMFFENFVQDLRGTLKLIMTEDEGKPN